MKTFTALALTAVLFLLGASLIGGCPNFSFFQWARENKALTQESRDFHAISSALKTYKINVGHYPSTEQGLMALVERPAIPPRPKDWVRLSRSVPTDPWLNEYRYRHISEENEPGFELISCGADGILNTEDDKSSLDT